MKPLPRSQKNQHTRIWESCGFCQEDQRDLTSQNEYSAIVRTMLYFLPPQALTGTLISLLFFVGSPSASGELTVDQVVILANRNSPASLSVAEHYAALRKVPNDHIVQLDLPVQETISREVYDRDLVQPTRQILEE